MDSVNKSSKKCKLLKTRNEPVLSLQNADSIYVKMVGKAIDILIKYCVKTLNATFIEEKRESLYRFYFHIARLIKPKHQKLYDEISCQTTSSLLKKNKKLSCTSYKEMAEAIYDNDYNNVYKILYTICKDMWYLPILNEYTYGLELKNLYFHVDRISFTIEKVNEKFDEKMII